jgi:hypothetical protein
MSQWSPPPPSVGNADNLLIQTDELSGMGVTMIAYVVPSKLRHLLLLSNGVARSYYSLIAGSGRTIDEFHDYCKGARLQSLVNDVEEVPADCSGTVRRDTIRKRVNMKLLELLSEFSAKMSGYRTQQTDLARQLSWNSP